MGEASVEQCSLCITGKCMEDDRVILMWVKQMLAPHKNEDPEGLLSVVGFLSLSHDIVCSCVNWRVRGRGGAYF